MAVWSTQLILMTDSVGPVDYTVPDGATVIIRSVTANQQGDSNLYVELSLDGYNIFVGQTGELPGKPFGDAWDLWVVCAAGQTISVVNSAVANVVISGYVLG